MATSSLGQIPTFVEHFMVATIADSVKVEVVEDLFGRLIQAITIPGVVATHLGRCIQVLGDHDYTFLMHIRASDTASCDAAYKAAHEVCSGHFTLHNITTKEDLKELLVIDYEAQPVGEWGGKWPALRVAIVKFKADTPKEKIARFEEVLDNVVSMFPLVKQVTWGRNVAKTRMYRKNYEYADVDQEFGICLTFSSCEDMDTLGADPKYWEVLNFYGISILEKYQVLTLCLG